MSACPVAVDAILGRRVFGNYVADKKLGEGGMGSVYRLKHSRLPATYAALKVMHAGETSGAQERFEQEALVAAAIGSHRVVKPLDTGRFDDGAAYIVMEYVAGRSLDQELCDFGALDVTSALKIACRVADTLAIAHEKGIVHRDIKPSNIMLVEEGEKDAAVKLLDFGVARASGELKVARTAVNVIVGTPAYMSPEAVTGNDVDGRTDVFSLGVVLYEMLTGEVPFGAPTIEGIYGRLLTEPVPTLARKRPAGLDQVPPAVEQVLLRALAKKPSERFTMLEFFRALAALLESPSGDVPSTRMSIVRPSKPRTPAPLSPRVRAVEALLDSVGGASATAGGVSVGELPPQSARNRLTASFMVAGIFLVVALFAAWRASHAHRAEAHIATAPALVPPAPASVATAATPAAVSPATVGHDVAIPHRRAPKRTGATVAETHLGRRKPAQPTLGPDGVPDLRNPF